MLSNLTIGKRIGLGFATVFLFLVIIITLAYSGIAKIVGNAGEVILGNELDAEFKQKEVDHLLWTEARQQPFDRPHRHGTARADGRPQMRAG
jgi:Na+-transporting methylmalonyl-CoA/oxaloacetate decarboxylase gamma subunit